MRIHTNCNSISGNSRMLKCSAEAVATHAQEYSYSKSIRHKNLTTSTEVCGASRASAHLELSRWVRFATTMLYKSTACYCAVQCGSVHGGHSALRWCTIHYTLYSTCYVTVSHTATSSLISCLRLNSQPSFPLNKVSVSNNVDMRIIKMTKVQ